MIYYTGDIHGQKHDIERFCKRFNPTREDIIVILGDVGANYGQDERDAALKYALKEPLNNSPPNLPNIQSCIK